MTNYNKVFRLPLNINLSLYCYQIIVVLFINVIIFINILLILTFFYNFLNKSCIFMLR
uniref:Uncharacterized protein n=1 Tax=Laurencia verruciformis TaxID=3073068 RepID=A0AA51NFC5_9FLOR|nr:hypothetical protein [Laurencia verruciformis]